jgi:uncharacterized protein YcbX
MVLRPDGTYLTARRQRRMLSLTAAPEETGGLVLTAPDGSTIQVDVPTNGPEVQVDLSRLDTVRAADPITNEWLSAQLGESVMLGWLDDPRRRSVSLTHGGRPGESLSLADAGPLLLTSMASLGQLNQWICDDAASDGEEQPVSEIVMRRFRPNLVVGGAIRPFIEDHWQTVQVGGVELRLGKQCDRCLMTTIDPSSLAGGKQPLRSLARHHQWDHKTWFGIRLIPQTVGAVHVGDLVVGGC